MLRTVVRVVSALLSVCVCVLAVGSIQESQSSFPAGTNHGLTVDTHNSVLTKADLIDGLNSFAADKEVVLAKVASNSSENREAKDLYWFGDHKPTAPGYLWFDPNVQGEVYPVSELGDRPLDGYYVMKAEAPDVKAFYQWADNVGLSLQDHNQQSSRAALMATINGSGSGLAVASVLILFISVSTMWFYSRGHSRNIRLQGGVAPWRIHTLDLWVLVRTAIAWCLVGWLVALIGVAVVMGVGRVPIVGAWSLALLAAVMLLMFCIFAVLSLVTRPRVALAASRETPWRSVSRIGVVLRVASVAVALVSIPFALFYTQTARQAHSEASTWEDASSVVRIMVVSSEATLSGDETYLARFDELVKGAESKGIAAMSLSLDQMADMVEVESSEFDHVIVTNREFVDLWKQDIELEPVERHSVADGLAGEVEDNLQVWERTEDSVEENSSWYTLSASSEPLPVIGSQADRGNAVHADHPLIVMVDDLSQAFAVDGVLDALVSNGQIVFTDASVLRELIDNTDTAQYIGSIDNVADQILDTAQKYDDEARIGSVSIVLAVAALLINLTQGALLWSEQNRRRIFIRHSSGAPFRHIQRWRVTSDIGIVVAAATFAGWLSFAMYDLAPIQVVITAGIIVLLYIPLSIGVHVAAQKSAWTAVIHRED